MADEGLNQDLFIFTNSSDQEGKIYFVPESEWRRGKYEVRQQFAVSIRDIFENGALLAACPMDDPNTQHRVFYGANLFLIDKTRVKLREGGSATMEALREERGKRQPEATGDSQAQHPATKNSPVLENDLFLLATADDDNSPRLYKLPQAMYASKEFEDTPPMNMGVSSVHDMIAHGVALAAMPPGAGTLCYVISLASLSTSNPAFKRR
jgi:hypothetical protein